MTQITEAVYVQGVLKPVRELDLPDQQRVRIIVEPISGSMAANRDEALARLRAGTEQMNFHLQGSPPSRDELHDRV